MLFQTLCNYHDCLHHIDLITIYMNSHAESYCQMNFTHSNFFEKCLKYCVKEFLENGANWDESYAEKRCLLNCPSSLFLNMHGIKVCCGHSWTQTNTISWNKFCHWMALSVIINISLCNGRLKFWRHSMRRSQAASLWNIQFHAYNCQI